MPTIRSISVTKDSVGIPTPWLATTPEGAQEGDLLLAYLVTPYIRFGLSWNATTSAGFTLAVSAAGFYGLKGPGFGNQYASTLEMTGTPTFPSAQGHSGLWAKRLEEPPPAGFLVNSAWAIHTVVGPPLFVPEWYPTVAVLVCISNWDYDGFLLATDGTVDPAMAKPSVEGRGLTGIADMSPSVPQTYQWDRSIDTQSIFGVATIPVATMRAPGTGHDAYPTQISDTYSAAAPCLLCYFAFAVPAGMTWDTPSGFTKGLDLGESDPQFPVTFGYRQVSPGVLDRLTITGSQDWGLRQFAYLGVVGDLAYPLRWRQRDDGLGLTGVGRARSGSSVQKTLRHRGGYR